MKVEIKLSKETREPYAVIYAGEMTEDVKRAEALLENAQSGVITIVDNERIVILRPEEIFMARVEDEKTAVYCESKKYVCAKRLYAFEALPGFMRISKSTVVNLRYLDCVEPSLGGLMLLVLRNGCRDYISRKYFPTFKKYLGI